MKNAGSEHEWKSWKTNTKKDGTITHYDLFYAILQSTVKNTVFESKTKRDILEGMLKNCPRLEKLKFLV